MTTSWGIILFSITASLLRNRLQKLRPFITHPCHAIILRNRERLATTRRRKRFHRAIRIPSLQPLLLGNLEFFGDITQLRLVFAINRLQALVQPLEVVLEQLFGGGSAVGRALQGLDVVFDGIAGVVVGLFSRLY